MTGGPGPTSTVLGFKPAAMCSAKSRACAYDGSVGNVRADPKIVTFGTS